MIRKSVFVISKVLFLGVIVMGLGTKHGEAADEAILSKGKAVYMTKGVCHSCHGVTGAGDGPAAAALNPKPRSFADGKFMYDTDGDGKMGTDTDLKNIINHGAVKYGGSPFMAARPDITGEDLDALVAYVQSLVKK